MHHLANARVGLNNLIKKTTMNFAEQILAFNQSLVIDESLLPEGIAVMNPFRDERVLQITQTFYRKYFDDNQKRFMIIGINPGRFGGGVTGIPFTDPHKLNNYCGIKIGDLSAPELSADFVYNVINQYGGTEKFYKKFFLTAVSPLGFLKSKNGKMINYNYYDSNELQEAIRDFIIDSITRQLAFGIHRSVCFCLGTGKNYEYLSKLNASHGFFKEIVPLSHPRFVMQYRRKKIDQFVDEYLAAFKMAEAKIL